MKIQLPDFRKLANSMREIWKPLSKPTATENASTDSAALSPRGLFKSVGVKLFLIFFVCIVILVLGVGLFSYYQSKSIIQEKVASATETTIQLAADGMERALKVYEDVTMQMLTDTDFMKGLRDINDSTLTAYDQLQTQQLISTKLNSFISGKDDVAGVVLINLSESGKDIGTFSSTRPNEDIRSTDWFKEAVEAEGAARWLPTRPDGYYGATESFGLSRLFRDPSTGSRNFVLLIELKERLLSSTLENLNLNGDAPVVIIDESSNLVRTPVQENIGQPFDVVLSADQQEASASLAQSFTVDGKLAIYKKMKVSGWLVAAAVPVDDLVREAERIWDITVIMVLVSIVIAIGAGFAVAQMVGRPLIRLRNLMREGERGNLTVRTRIVSRDEIGQVGISFNQMMEQITKLVQQTNHSAQEVLNTANVLLNVSKQTAVSAKEIAVATEEIANGASSLAVEAEKGNTITYEISSKMKEVAKANEEMDQAAAEVQEVSEQGTIYMTELIGKTNDTEQMTRNMVEKVDRLKESTSSIRKILDVLNNVTKQTNILSLNATIEAARAGAAGKGFMVVADEIRKLAEQSKQSIEVVAQITETIQREINETVVALSDAYPVFQQQITSVKEAELIFKQVRAQMAGLGERLSGVTESVASLERSQATLADAMSNVSAVSEESSATSEEVASLSNEQLSVSQGLVKLSENLDKLSSSLQEQLAKFKV